MELSQEQMIAELRKPLDPKNIKPAPKGKFGTYVDGYHVIAEANRIFGELGWSYCITRLEKVSEQTVELKGRNPGDTYEQVRVGYMCTVRVDAHGTHKEGSAVGTGVGNPNSIADHHEGAVKEAETDALKRALRSFGNTFGLALYDKAQANVGIEEPTPPPEPKPTPAHDTVPTGRRTPDEPNAPEAEMPRMQDYVEMVALVKKQTAEPELSDLMNTSRFQEFKEEAPWLGGHLWKEAKEQLQALRVAGNVRAA